MTALVLTGGGSRRMGRPKAWLDIGGRACIARVRDAARAAAFEVEFQGALPGLREAFPQAAIREDARPGEGPLAALATGLRRHRDGAVLLLACDLPFLSADLLRGVAAGLPAADWSVPSHGDRLHPLCAAYGPAALAVAEQLLAAGRRDMRALLAHPGLRGRRLALDPRWGDPERLLLNVNTPADLERARALAADPA